MLKRVHTLSFGLGIVSGILVLVVVVHAYRILRPAQSSAGTAQGFTNQQGQRAPNLARMAQRLGISEQKLQAELDTGKTMQQIAQQLGVELSARGNLAGRGPEARSASVSSMTSSMTNSRR